PIQPQANLAIPRVTFLTDVSVHLFSGLELEMARQVLDNINNMPLLFRLCGLRLNRYFDFLPWCKLRRAYLDGAVGLYHRARVYHCSHRRFTVPFHRTMFSS